MDKLDGVIGVGLIGSLFKGFTEKDPPETLDVSPAVESTEYGSEFPLSTAEQNKIVKDPGVTSLFLDAVVDLLVKFYGPRSVSKKFLLKVCRRLEELEDGWIKSRKVSAEDLADTTKESDDEE
jgi:hypothetical protein